jgi:hypothetical protein
MLAAPKRPRDRDQLDKLSWTWRAACTARPGSCCPRRFIATIQSSLNLNQSKPNQCTAVARMRFGPAVSCARPHHCRQNQPELRRPLVVQAMTWDSCEPWTSEVFSGSKRVWLRIAFHSFHDLPVGESPITDDTSAGVVPKHFWTSFCFSFSRAAIGLLRL